MASFVTTAEKRIEAKARHYSNRARGVASRMRGTATDAIDAVREGSQPF